MSLISPSYVDSLFAQRDELGQAWLSSLICGTQRFDPHHPMYGLPPSLFLFVEDLLWFAQSTRSGAWTYFEGTSPERQTAMSMVLAAEAPSGWPERYASGREHWQDVLEMQSLDQWISERDAENTDFLWDHLARHRQLLDELVA